MDMNEDMITLFLDKIGHQKLKDVFYKMIQDFAIGREHLQRLYENPSLETITRFFRLNSKSKF